ncbi:MAG: M1 family metallopeptidase [Saprospiraceae bacterium]|nr:M1 family metallopeptidase [Saprospiraceae bacterium]
MLRYTVLFLFILLTKPNAQNSYFQQELKYKIVTELDDNNHTLQSFIEIKYKNNSPHILDKIAIHLWPNAYKHRQTAFAKQKLRMGDLRFHEASADQLGSIEELDFKVNGEHVRIQYSDNAGDYCWLLLNQALEPHKEITITTPFILQIPENFSRLGRGHESYQITQWYPKPAVYDHKGWHLMPYLDYGEFYSEFGSFEVEITLPEDYVVAATGTLLTPEEISFLNERINISNQVLESKMDLPQIHHTSSLRKKTLHYRGDSIHDFAWFADKGFLVQKSGIELQNGKKVDTWVFFKNKELWKDAIQFVDRSLGFFSNLIGEYPWPQATAVESELNAGGGMEYPMITVLGTMYNSAQLDEVIAHEIAHNWFYGVLGFNERDHPFLDEGITSYFEQRYMEQFYKENEWTPGDGWIEKLFKNVSAEKFQYLLFARPYRDQNPNQNANNFSAINYGLDVYDKSSKLFRYAESWLGKTQLDKLFSSFYQQWKFKHPYPEDLENHFRENSSKDFSWLFKGFFSSHRKMDYSMGSIRKSKDEIRIEIKNSGQIPAPFTLSGIRNGELAERQWIDGFSGSRTFESSCIDCDFFSIDIDQESFDLYENNNQIRTRGLFKKIEKVKLRLLPILDHPRITDIGITPVINYNEFNGISPGLFISGPFLPFRKFKLQLMPLYSIRTKDLTGTAGLSYYLFFPDKKVHHLKLELDFKKYAYAKFSDGPFLNYSQWKPSISFVFNHIPPDHKKSEIKYSLFADRNDYQDYSDTTQQGFQKKKIHTITHVLDYKLEKPSILGDLSLDFRMIYFNQKIISPLRQEFLRTDLVLNKSFRISDKRYVKFRTYFSFFPINSERNSSTISSRTSPYYFRGSTGLSLQNYQDELNEYYFIGRTESSGIASQQISLHQGGFKIPLGSAYRETIGNSNTFVGSLNISSDLPVSGIGKFIKPYLDIGYYHSEPASTQGNWLWSAGLQIQVIADVFSIYFPVTHSGNLKDLLQDRSGKNYLKQISFSLNFQLTEEGLMNKLFSYQ